MGSVVVVHMGSIVVVPGLQSTVSIFVMHRLSSSKACGIFPDQRSNSCLLHWQVDSLPLSHQGSPYINISVCIYIYILFIFFSIISYYKVLNIVPYVVQQDLIIYLFYMQQFVSISPNLYISLHVNFTSKNCKLGKKSICPHPHKTQCNKEKESHPASDRGGMPCHLQEKLHLGIPWWSSGQESAAAGATDSITGQGIKIPHTHTKKKKEMLPFLCQESKATYVAQILVGG